MVESPSRPEEQGEGGEVEALRRRLAALQRARDEALGQAAYYRSILDEQDELIWRNLPDGRITFANKALCRFYGKAEAELLGQAPMPDIPAEDMAIAVADVSSFTPERPTRVNKHRVIMPGGEVRWLEFVDRALFDEQGNLAEIQTIGRDVTALVEAEDRLRQSEARYREVVQDQTELICRVDAEGRFTFANAAYCRYFGKTPEELLGQPYEPFIYEQDKPLLQAHLASYCPERDTGCIEHRVVLPTGEVRWQQWNNRACFDEQGRLIGFQAVGRDVTALRRAREELQRANANLRAIIEASPAAVVSVDRQANLLIWNPAAERMFGYRKQELNRALPSIATEEQIGQLERLFQQILAGVPVLGMSASFRRADGQAVDVRVYAAPVWDEQGMVSGVMAVAIDETERLRTEEVLRAAVERERMLARHVSDVIFRIRLVPDQGLDYVSPSFTSLTGYDAEELYNDASLLYRLIHPADVDTALDLVRAPAQRRRPLAIRWITRSGEVIWTENRVAPVRDGSGRIVAIEGVARNITPPGPGQVPSKAREPQVRVPVSRVSSGGDSNWMRLTLALPPAVGAPSRPTTCPHCGSAILQRHQRQWRAIKDGTKVQVVRYLCADCHRTFSLRPQGVNRGTQSERLRLLTTVLYGLGLSGREISHALAQAGVELSPSSIWRTARAAAEPMRRSKPAGVSCVLSDEKSPSGHEFIVLDRLDVSPDDGHPAGLELLIWDRRGRVLAWLREHLARLGVRPLES